MPPASNIWTPQREVTLVDELFKPATDPEVIRRKLNALCKVYFRELKDLDAEASPEKHLIPWGRLPIDRYQRRRKHLATVCPWWDKMHAMMIERQGVINPTTKALTLTSSAANSGPANVKMEAMDSQDASSLERFTVDAAVSQAAALFGGKTFRTWKIEAKALRLQNTQLQTQLELEQSKVENLRLRERVRILEASAQEPARREEEGEQDRRRGSSRRRGSRTRSRRTTSTGKGKGKGKEKARDRADSDTLTLSSDTEDSMNSDSEDSDDEYVPEESSSPQKRPKK
ncbi:hypothetical protein OC846_003475 [Tilletia horrida]|uniref:Uncharacterized protein n=1 Tax=Tilletia horrida TaxID=155126 RepID=A0AAN6JRA3_9BASI|nr:hypothetical protein OC846_003475 [Tilletia horrida]